MLSVADLERVWCCLMIRILYLYFPSSNEASGIIAANASYIIIRECYNVNVENQTGISYPPPLEIDIFTNVTNLDWASSQIE